MLARKYKLKFLSSGLLYRYASYLILKYKPAYQINFLRKKFKKLNYKKLKEMNLHSPKISELSAIIAKKNNVRKILKNYQINFAKKNKKCCIEGRDISTKILPEAYTRHFASTWSHIKELKKQYKNLENNFSKSKRIIEKCVSIPIFFSMKHDFSNKIHIAVKNTLK